MSDTDSRPTAVSVAFWLLLIGAVMLLLGGLLTLTVSFGTLRQAAPVSVSDEAIHDILRLYRGIGVVFAAAGAGLGMLVIRVGRGDPRSRRAAVALGLAIVVVVGIAAVLGGTHILVLLSLLPIIAGALLLSRPAVAAWFGGRNQLTDPLPGRSDPGGGDV